MARPRRQPPGQRWTDDDLLRASRALGYELDMFLELHDGWRVAARPANDAQRILNALLEAWVLHFRILVDFVYPLRPEPDVIGAADFFDSPDQWADLGGRISHPLAQARQRAHREVLSLTACRPVDPSHEETWDRGALQRELLPVLRRFAGHAPGTRLDPRVKARLGL